MTQHVLLVHGLTSDGTTWAPVARALEAAGCSVTRPDLRGHGRSGPSDDYSLAAYASDLVPLTPTEGSWDLVVGHSLGGAATLLAAASTPGWTRRLVLLDPVLQIDDDPAHLALEDNRSSLGLTEQQYRDANPAWSDEDVRLKVEAARRTTAEVVERTILDNLPWDVTSSLGQVDAPVLVVGADPTVGWAAASAEQGGTWSAAHAHVDFTVAPGAGHSVQRDARAWLLALLADQLGVEVSSGG